jgi:hypothetical protein
MSPEVNNTLLSRQTNRLQFPGDSYKAWCEECCDVVLGLELDSAARFMRIPFKALGDLFAVGRVHVVEKGSRSPLVCGNSILTSVVTVPRAVARG